MISWPQFLVPSEFHHCLSPLFPSSSLSAYTCSITISLCTDKWIHKYTNMQICKCTPCSHTLQMDSWFVDSDSDQISRSVVSDSLRPHESQHARPPCPSPTPGVHWDSRPSSQWCHPAISSSGVPFSSCPRSLPASESFPITVAKSICVLCSWYCPEKGMI